MARDTETHLDLEKLTFSLATGFETLLQEVKDLADRETNLRKQFDAANMQYNKSLPHSPSAEKVNTPFTNGYASSETQVSGDTIDVDPTTKLMANPAVRDAIDACKKIKRKPSQITDSKVRKCPVTHQTTDQEDFEHDFTTSGVQGNLECPFAKMVQNGSSPISPIGLADPIAAEFHQDHASVNSVVPPVDGPGKCPIRFLDQHSPEEVAKYFENHKHEIPRSHEICVKRYQQNEQSIRQLDAKYGNLVNMIQGLGVKHKQYLPEDEEAELRRNGGGSVEAVEKWADTISYKVPDPPVEEQDLPNGIDEEDGRKPHFERPLREIRVGESPSRPWGISVPAAQKPSESAMLSDRGTEPVSLPRSEVTAPKLVKAEKLRRCPIDHGQYNFLTNAAETEKANKVTGVEHSKGQTSSQPHIVFNGPVFFGYSAEQAAVLLQSGNLNFGTGIQ